MRGPRLSSAASAVSFDVDAVYRAKCACVGRGVGEVSISEMCVFFYNCVTLGFFKNAFEMGFGRNGGTLS